MVWSPGDYYVVIYNDTGEFDMDNPYTLDVEVLGSGMGEVSPASPVTLEPTIYSVNDSVETLFLINTTRMKERFPGKEKLVDAITTQVNKLAENPAVKGKVIDLANLSLEGETLQEMYDLWDMDPYNFFQANRIAQTIDNVVTAATIRNPSNAADDGSTAVYTPPFQNVKYIVLIGPDSVIPHYRTPDLTTFATEFDYFDRLAQLGVLDFNSALGGTFDYGSVMTDDIYGNDTPYTSAVHPFYIQNRAVGRLVEQPEEILAYLEQYTTGQAPLVIDATKADSKVAVTGYDFAADQADAIATMFETMGLKSMNRLIDFPPFKMWNDADLFRTWFDDLYEQYKQSPYTVQSRVAIQSINGHFEHFQTIPAEADGNDTAPTVLAQSLFEPSTHSDNKHLYFENNICYTIGCHSGLNVEEDALQPDAATFYYADFPQAFVKHGGNIIGNTGYGYGDYDLIAYSERLSQLYTAEIGRNATDDGTYVGQTIGDALVQAKLRYMSNSTTFDMFDVKTLTQATLYGLPFIRVKVPNPTDFPDEYFSPDRSATTPPTSSYGVNERTITFRPTYDDAVQVERTTKNHPGIKTIDVEDSFISTGTQPPDRRIIVKTQEGEPVLPQFAYDITALNYEGKQRMVVKDVEFVEGTFKEITNYQPQITFVITQNVPEETPTFPQAYNTWFPGFFYDYTTTGESGQQRDQIVVRSGQYRGDVEDGTQGTMRLYEEMTFRVVYVDTASENADAALNDDDQPIIEDVQIVVSATHSNTAKIMVLVQDAPGDDQTGMPDTGGVGGFYTFKNQPAQGARVTSNLQWSKLSFIREQVEGDKQVWTADVSGGDPAGIELMVTAKDNAGNTTYYNGKGTLKMDQKVALSGITISGSKAITVSNVVTLTTSLVPINATRPMSYTWSGQPVRGQGDPWAAYQFAETGVYSVTVTVKDMLTGQNIQSQPFAITVAKSVPSSEGSSLLYLPLVTR